MSEAKAVASSEDHRGSISAIREEMRFEIGVFHERINALISAEAFLLISFTMALAYDGHGAHPIFFWISPLSLQSASLWPLWLGPAWLPATKS